MNAALLIISSLLKGFGPLASLFVRDRYKTQRESALNEFSQKARELENLAKFQLDAMSPLGVLASILPPSIVADLLWSAKGSGSFLDLLLDPDFRTLFFGKSSSTPIYKG